MNRKMLNVRLRRATVDDAELHDRLRNQASSIRFQASPKRSLEEVRSIMAAQEDIAVDRDAVGKLFWVIEVDGDDVGLIQLDISPGLRQQLYATMGYTVAESAQGRGVATEAVRQAIEIAFGPLGLERIEAVAAVANVASRRVLEKSGFQFEGVRRGLLRVQGLRVDHACYGILVTDERNGKQS